MFAVAIALSAIAAFYSIVGLTAIFAAAVMPIIIMGTILEIAKVVVTVWLHEYWRQCRLLMKMYLVPAVFVLMVITSMGIFGFLSKAHLDQVVPTGDVQAQVQLIDEKINNERDTIANARSLLAQLDRAVVDISNAPDREVNGRVISSAERALQVRRQQARDRANLTQTIESAQARIVQLQEQKAPFAKDLRKIEAEVGPIKYIAALIYGDNPDANLLEKAVRWVIIILVAVFDPLAIMMLLAATESLTWTRRRQEETPNESLAIHSADQAQSKSAVPADDRFVEQPPTTGEPMVDIATTATGYVAARSLDDNKESQALLYVSPQVQMPNTDEPQAVVEQSDKPELNDSENEEHEDRANPVMKQAKDLWKQDNPSRTLKEQRRLLAEGNIDRLPWENYLDDPRIERVMTVGIAAPDSAVRGDIWANISQIPTRIMKFNGDHWIEIDKNLSDRYAYDDAYISYLVDRIASGEYDPDLLTDSERAQIEEQLRRTL
jgi:hypothetical protein